MDLIRQHFVELFSLPIFPPTPPGPGSRIPPEIFETILYHASRNDTSKEARWRWHEESRHNPALDAGHMVNIMRQAKPRYTLTACALVSRYWANECRKYMFTGATVHVHSFENAQAFRKYALHGEPKLVKICDLIKAIEVRQYYYLEPKSSSFLHLVYLPATRNKLVRVAIHGPIPASIPPCMHDTPHWGLPNTTIVSLSPMVTAYNRVFISDIHFPSFLHLSKYLSYFRNAENLLFEALTWDGKFAPVWRVHKSRARSPLHTSITVSKCTDNILVCMQAVMWYPNFPLHAVSERDQHWAIDLMAFVTKFYHELPPAETLSRDKGSDVPKIVLDSRPSPDSEFSDFTFSVYGKEDYASIILHFVCGTKPSTPGVWHSGSSPRPIRIIGLGVEIRGGTEGYDTRHTTVDLSVLRREIEERCALRVVAFAFGSRGTMEKSLEVYPELCEPMPVGGQEYVFLCERSVYYMKEDVHPFPEVPLIGDRDWVFVDPLTMGSTGEAMGKETEWPRRDIVVRLLQRHG